MWMLCLFWNVLLLFSIVTTKIIHYSSMTWIPLSFIAAYTLYLIDQKKIDLSKVLKYLYLGIGVLLSFVFLAIAYLISNNFWLAGKINDKFVADCLRQSLNVSPLAYGTGFLMLAGVVIGFVFLHKKKITEFAITTASSVMLALLIAHFNLLPKVEQVVQGPAIEFYERMQKEKLPLFAFQYQSYGQYFYCRTKDTRKDLPWFIDEKLDFPVYMVVKTDNELIHEFPQFKLIETKGGFSLYKKAAGD